MKFIRELFLALRSFRTEERVQKPHVLDDRSENTIVYPLCVLLIEMEEDGEHQVWIDFEVEQVARRVLHDAGMIEVLPLTHGGRDGPTSEGNG